MAWLKGFAGKAEDFLNQLDTGAAIVLNNSQNQERRVNFTIKKSLELENL